MCEQARRAFNLRLLVAAGAVISQAFASSARHSTRRHRMVALACLVCCVVGLVTGCGVPTTGRDGVATSGASAPPNATATAAAQPVLIHLTASTSGTIAANSLALRVATTVINQTGQTIHLVSYPPVLCLPMPPVVFSLVNTDHKMVWQETHTESCPIQPFYDVATIAAGESQKWTTTFDLRCVPYSCYPLIIPGSYTLVGTGLLWRQGHISLSGETTAPSGYAGSQP